MKNVVLVIVDCLRYDTALGHYQFLLPGSLVFHSCWATAGATVPAVHSVLTGLLPADHGAVKPGDRPLAPTILDFAREKGYHTLAVTENPYTRWLGQYFPSYQPLPEGGFVTPGIGAQYIREHLPPEPYFVLYHYMRVHHPYVGHPNYKNGKAVDPYDLNGSGKCPWEIAQKLRAAYERGAANSAHCLYALYRDMDATFIVTADHGEAFWEHGFVTHISDRFVPELLHVPLIVADRRKNPTVDCWKPISTAAVPAITEAAFSGRRHRPRASEVRAEDYQQPLPVAGAYKSGWWGILCGDDVQYYNLSADPGMHHPCEPPTLVKNQLASHLVIRPVTGQSVSIDDDEAVLERLRDLGYVE